LERNIYWRRKCNNLGDVWKEITHGTSFHGLSFDKLNLQKGRTVKQKPKIT
jgi:hypothetical protein